MTTHSPVAVRELSGDQLFVLRNCGTHHEARNVGGADDVQGTIRKYPDALLATTIVVCEGASEVGLLRGFDQYRTTQGQVPLAAHGAAFVDGGGHELFKRAIAFRSLGYRVAVLRDSDVHPTPELETVLLAGGGKVFRWRAGRALEDELFLSLGAETVAKMLALAVSVKDEMLVNEHIKSASQNARDLASVRAECAAGLTPETRALLGRSARFKGTKGWFKSVSAMEEAARDIIGPGLAQADPAIGTFIDDLFAQVANGGS